MASRKSLVPILLPADPTAPLEAATKQYVDAQVAGLSNLKTVRAATTTALPAVVYSNGSSGVGATLIASSLGALGAIDGVTLIAGDTLLVKNQASAFQNGKYVVTTVGNVGVAFVLTRSTDSDQAAENGPGETFVVQEGSTLADTYWIQTTANPITMGTTNLVYTRNDIGLAVLKANNGSDFASIPATRANLNVESLHTVADANYTILATDRVTVWTSISAPRVATLPAASALNPGQSLVVGDASGSVTATNTITVTRVGSDTINGATTAVISSPNGIRTLISDGVSKWSFDDGQVRKSQIAALAAHGIVVANGASITAAGPDTAGKILIAQGTGADPTFNAMSGDATIDSAGAVTIPALILDKIGTIVVHGHSWVAAQSIANAGTPNFESQGALARLAGMLDVHSDNITNGGQVGSYLTRATSFTASPFGGWAWLASFLTPLTSPLIADSTAISPVPGASTACPGANLIVHGINDAALYGGFQDTNNYALILAAWSSALRWSISRMRAGALYSSYLNTTGAIVWPAELAFSGGTTTASIGLNTGPGVRRHTTNGDTDTYTIPTNVPAAFTVAFSYVATGQAYAYLVDGDTGTGGNQNASTSTTGWTMVSGFANDFVTGDIIKNVTSGSAELIKITAGGGSATWTVSRGFNGTTATTHAINDVFIKAANGQVNFTGTAANATGSLVVDSQGSGPGSLGQSKMAVVKRFACTSADAGKTIIATVAGILASAPNEIIDFDSVWIEALDPPPTVVVNLPRFQWPGNVPTQARAASLNSNTTSVVAEFDGAVKIADFDTPIWNRGGVLANTALNNTTSGTITGVAVTANSTDFQNATGWVMVDNDEQMLVTAISGSYPNYTVSVTRGYNSSTIVAHASGALISDRTWWHTDNTHPNAYGHGVLAKVIYDAFKTMTSLTTYQLAHAAGNNTQDARVPVLGIKDNWYIEFNNNTAMAVNSVFTLDTIWYWPFYIPQECICTGIAIVTGTTTAGTATAVRMGLYDVAADRYLPGNLIQEFGTGATTALTTVVEVAGHKILLPGWYYVAFNNQGTTAGTVHTVTNLGYTPYLPFHMVSAVPTGTSGKPFFNQTTTPGGVLPVTANAAPVIGPAPLPWVHLRSKQYA